jgi:chorismate mutase
MFANCHLLQAIEKMRIPPRLLLALLLCITANSGVYAEALFDLMNQRLGYMRDVAVHKAKQNIPVEDRAREQAVLNRSIEKARQQGLDAGSVKAFFVAQINVAKGIQRRYHQQWALEQDHVGFPLPDLNGSIRPALNKLGEEIIEALPAYLNRYGLTPESKRQEFYQSMTVDRLTEQDKKQLFDALLEVRLAR